MLNENLTEETLLSALEVNWATSNSKEEMQTQSQFIEAFILGRVKHLMIHFLLFCIRTG